MGRIERLTKHLKEHDRELYADWFGDHECIAVYRQGKSLSEPVPIGESEFIRMSRPSPHFVFALTDNWKTNGRPVSWGIEPVMARIRAMDLWRNESLVEDLIKSYQKQEESNERGMANNVESFLLDFRRQFARTFSDVNTSNLSKIDNRSKKDGN